jgi:hypothetical protein
MTGARCLFEIREAGRPIGHSALESFDEGMGIATGAFMPTPDYETVRPVFRLFADASRETSAQQEDPAQMAEFRRAATELRLELVGPEGSVVPTSFIHVYDFSVEGGPDAYEVEAQISDRAAWEIARRA